jgi:hypothetical protein
MCDLFECLIFSQPGTDIQQYVQEKKADFRQPHIICVGNSVELGPFFVIFNHQVLMAGHCPLRAVELPVKTHYVFDVLFCTSLAPSCNFVEDFLFKLHAVRATAKVIELEALLSNLPL